MLKDINKRLSYWKQRKNEDFKRMNIYLEKAKYYKKTDDRYFALHEFNTYKMYRKFYISDLEMIKKYENRRKELKSWN